MALPSSIPPGSALGLVETLGLVASIEAADAMLKAADVRLVRKHKVDAGMISHIVVGETSAVQAAVDAGRAAAERVGRVDGALVIPRPSDDVWSAMLGIRVGADAPAPDDDTADTDTAEDDAADGPPSGPVPATAPPDRDYDAMSVRALRTIARERDDVTLHGRAVATASKDDLVADLRAADPR